MSAHKGARPKKPSATVVVVSPAAEERPERIVWLGLTILGAALVYAGTLGGDWLWDDEALVIAPRLMGDAAGLARIWRGDGTLDYFPLTLTSFWLENRMFDGPTGHRIVNLALHAVSACLVGSVALRARVPHGRAVGLLFAVHPLAVSSVAWVSERKNTLSFLFALLAILAALPKAEKWPTSRALALSVFFFVLALLSKTQIVALPIVLFGLMALRGWPVPRRSVFALSAMLAIAFVLGLVTIRFQNATPGFDAGGLPERALRASDSVLFYLRATIWPSPLAMVHARDAASTGVRAYLALGALALALVVLGRAAKAGRPWGSPALFALLAYVVLLAPALGLVDMSFMRFAFVSEHFSYVALPIPLACFVSLVAKLPRERASIVIGATALALALVSRGYASVFTSRDRLWSHNVEVAPESATAQGNYALAREQDGHHVEALAAAREAVRLAPWDGELHMFLGTVLMQQGRLDEAGEELERALELQPNLERAHNNLGAILVHQGRLDEATVHLRAALAITPDYAIGHMNLARVLAARGRMGEAEAERARAISLDPALASMPLVPPAPP